MRLSLRALPWFALVAGLAVALVLLLRGSETADARAAAELAADLGRIQIALERHAELHTQSLRQVAAALELAPAVGEPAFAAYIGRIAKAPGLAGITAIGRIGRGSPTATVVPLVAIDDETLGHARSLGRITHAGAIRLVDDRAIAPGMFIVVPLGADGDAVFSYFHADAFITAALRDVRRTAHLRIDSKETNRSVPPILDDGASDAAPAASGVARIGDATWQLRASMPPEVVASFADRSGALAALALAVLAFGALLWSGAHARTHTPATEAAAQRGLARAAGLVDVAPDAILGLDRSGTIVVINRAAEHMFRLPASDAIGRPIASLVPGMDAERIARALADGLTAYGGGYRSARVGVTAERRGGVSFPVELELGDATEANDACVTCIVRDVTESRRAEEEMRLYKRAIAASSNSISIADVTLPDQPILYVNPAFERDTGYDLADVLGRNSRFLQGQDTDPGAIAKIRSAIARGAECQVTLKNYTKDGDPFWNHLTLAPVRDRSGRVTHYIGIGTDVTEIKQIESALEERREQLDAIFTLSPDGFVAFGRDRRVSYANPAFLRITNLEQDVVQGAPIERLDELLKACSDPANPFKPFADLTREMGAGASGARDVVVATTRFQDTLHLRNPAPKILQRSIRRASGGTTEFVAYLRDMTRETEVDRMKSEFLSSAAHELRTPMASIFGFTELLLRRNFGEEQRRDLLQTIHKQAKHLTNLINELLDLARIEARAGKDLKLEEQSLLPLVRETVASLLMQNDSRRVETTLPESLPPVRIDTGKMRQALTNILSNAYKYSPDGGRIELTTEVRSAGDRDFLGIRVRDEGIGMTPEQLAHACERFYRADTSGRIPGTGLGLSLVKEIMELQGGSIELKSEYGKGTSVTLWLPVQKRMSARVA